MFDTIILLTGPTERAILVPLLRQHNPQITVCPITSAAEIDALEPDLLARARLVGFVTPVVVHKRILDALGFGAYNFHPGPPHYPGWLPAHFAIYDRAKDFGATVHLMIERVDAGPIVGVELFSIPPDASVQRLEELAFIQVAQLFWRLANTMVTRCEPLTELPLQWSGRKSTRRMYAALCDIPIDISKDELDRRIEAFGGGHFGLNTAITLHGRQFRYIAPEADAKADAPSIAPADQRMIMMKRAG
jgi:methionyl-tRNA formyltransferase